jgi:hypothetical protein
MTAPTLAIHLFILWISRDRKTWMPGTRPGTTLKTL